MMRRNLLMCLLVFMEVLFILVNCTIIAGVRSCVFSLRLNALFIQERFVH